MEEVEGYDPERRLTLLANCGCLITLCTFVACWFGSEDPLGAPLSCKPPSATPLAFAVLTGWSAAPRLSSGRPPPTISGTPRIQSGPT
jgi:hypothetical protein